MRPGPYVAAYDDETDAFVFQLPGEAESRRFQPFVVHTERGPTKVWAVGTLARL
jgi:hypothetical protein